MTDACETCGRPHLDPRDALIAQMQEALEAHVEAEDRCMEGYDVFNALDRHAMAMTRAALAKAGMKET